MVVTAEERQAARYCDWYGHMTYPDFLVWQQGGDETISDGGKK